MLYENVFVSITGLNVIYMLIGMHLFVVRRKEEKEETEEPNNYSTRNKSLLKCMKSVLYII